MSGSPSLTERPMEQQEKNLCGNGAEREGTKIETGMETTAEKRAWIYCAIDAPEDTHGILKKQFKQLIDYGEQMGFEDCGQLPVTLGQSCSGNALVFKILSLQSNTARRIDC